MQLATDEHRAGALTTTYAQQLAHEATDALVEARGEMSAGSADTVTAPRARIATDSLAHAIHALLADVSR